MIFYICVGLVIVFFMICFGVKYYTKIVRRKINSQIWEMLHEMFNINTIDIQHFFNIEDSKQTLTLLQIIINSLGDTIQYFRSECDVCEEKITTICLESAKEKCKELGIEVNQESENFIKTIILSYIRQHQIV